MSESKTQKSYGYYYSDRERQWVVNVETIEVDTGHVLESEEITQFDTEIQAEVYANRMNEELE